MHATLRARLATLGTPRVARAIAAAIGETGKRDPRAFRILHFSARGDELHVVVEASSARALSSGMRSVAIRVAFSVNAELGRRGPLWADRWRGRALTTPREVRAALAEVPAPGGDTAAPGATRGIRR